MIGGRLAHVRDLLEPWIEADIFGSLEVHAADRIAGSVVSHLTVFDALSVASAVWSTQQGHVCFDLRDANSWSGLPAVHRPDRDAWVAHLATSPLVQMSDSWTSSCDSTRPLVMCDQRLYLTRQWIDEAIVADEFRRRLGTSLRKVDIDVIDELFESEDRGGPQYQGVLEGVKARTSILTGGPGTGKTYTIARILVAAVRHGVRSIALAAPTAKAAVQMRDSLSAALGADLPGLDDDQRHLLERLEPSTIHRLLGSRPGSSTRFRDDSVRRLPHDLIVIDEMSMVSLPLMARLLEAVDPATTLVLVGDPGQLDSVENGSILRDLTSLDLGPSMPVTVLTDSRRNRGTRSSSFADAVRTGDVDRALEILGADDDDGTLRWIEMAEPLSAIAQIHDVIESWRGLARRLADGETERALSSVNDARILCPHRDGPSGVATWNAEISDELETNRDRWRVGDIVVKTRNDLGQGLANGDIGVVTRVEGALSFLFRHGDAAFHVPVAIDDAVDLGFATTVHKAQGSEFSTVGVVVPPAHSPSSTRELLYTALTRAKPRAILIGTRQDIEHAVVTQRRRWSGLSDRLSTP
ncbi:MAG: exodeoxyribonuclease V subunit alpha [Actinomycetota bacterium]